jgi:hypothetical protein
MHSAPRIVAIGSSAAAALAASGGALRAIPGFADAPYRLAGTEIVWIGTRGEPHPRAVFLDQPLGEGRLAWDADHPAPARHGRTGPLARAAAAAHFGALARNCRQLGQPRGCGCLLAGLAPPFPLSARAEAMHALAATIAGDDPAGLVAAGVRLLGVGGGLTPSGDDFVGAALFTLAHLRSARWRQAAAELTHVANERTHAISAALFADLARGESFAPLHDLLAAADASAMGEPAQRLVNIGHSSGWDMLTGMIAAATGTLHHSTH